MKNNSLRVLPPAHKGFTLIELSIVLVIIGLIVGGVLVGRDLIDAAQLRAQISQIEEIQTAVNTFQNKFNCLPGDCKQGSNFGFVTRKYPSCSQTAYANGDGDGLIGTGSNTDNFFGPPPENLLFWDNLADAGLIVGRPSSCNLTSYSSLGIPGVMGKSLVFVALYTPVAVGYNSLGGGRYGHYLTLTIPGASYWSASSAIGELLTPAQAYQIDVKVDNGLPGSGNVLATQGGKAIVLNGPIGSEGVTAPDMCAQSVSGNWIYANPSVNVSKRCDLNFASQGW